MPGIKMIGCGSALPTRTISNEALSQKLNTSHEWIVTRTGIEQRFVAQAGETTSTLATQAAEKALRRAQCSAQDIDVIIVATTTADQVFPSVACMVQRNLGMENGVAFDVQAVCSGFVFALDQGYRMLQSQDYHRALIIGAETMSRILNWEDRSTAVLFGDGAGAVVLESGHDQGIVDSVIRSDGRYAPYLQVEGGISQGYDRVQKGQAYMTMNGRQVYKFAVHAMAQTVKELLQRNDKTVADLRYLIPHQANIRMLRQVAEALDLESDQVITTVSQHANTSAASIPLALDWAVQRHKIKRDDLIAFVAVGGGFTWGGTLLYF